MVHDEELACLHQGVDLRLEVLENGDWRMEKKRKNDEESRCGNKDRQKKERRVMIGELALCNVRQYCIRTPVEQAVWECGSTKPTKSNGCRVEPSRAEPCAKATTTNEQSTYSVPPPLRNHHRLHPLFISYLVCGVRVEHLELVAGGLCALLQHHAVRAW